MGTLILIIVCFCAGVYAHKYQSQLKDLIKKLFKKLFGKGEEVQ